MIHTSATITSPYHLYAALTDQHGLTDHDARWLIGFAGRNALRPFTMYELVLAAIASGHGDRLIAYFDELTLWSPGRVLDHLRAVTTHRAGPLERAGAWIREHTPWIWLVAAGSVMAATAGATLILIT